MCVEIMGRRLYLWLMVEADEYELPLAVADSASELAKMVGVTTSTVEICAMRDSDGSISGHRYKKVRREE